MVDQVDNLKKKKKKKKNKQKEDGEKVKRVTGSFFNKQLFYRVDIHFFANFAEVSYKKGWLETSDPFMDNN